MAPRAKHSARKASSSSQTHRSTSSLQKTEVFINVYDLLPPGRLSSALWIIGSSLLHSAVVVNEREYAYGGTEQKGISGVYWTRPRTEPPGGTFRAEILHGFTFQSEEEIQATIKEVSEEFDGASYNLLTKNCNHFTSTLCERLTSRAAPKWVNRAAGIGLALPCIVPKEWIDPPDYETAAGELVDEDGHPTDSHSGLLIESPNSRQTVEQATSSSKPSASNGNSTGSSEHPETLRDTSGRVVPQSEIAPGPVS